MDNKAFNKRLNKQDAENRYSSWQPYRKLVTGYMLEHIKPGDSVIVIGAGNCDDIDLVRLVERCGSLVLTDIDDDAVSRGLECQKVNVDSKRIEVTVIDYLDDQWSVQDRHYDVVVCMPIYTQLFFPMENERLLAAYQNGNIGSEEMTAKQRELLDRMPDIIRAFNRKLIELMRDEGRLVVYSDLIEDKPDGPYIEAFGDGLSYDVVIDDYVSTYGMGLGNYGLFDLEQQLIRRRHHWFLWPFGEVRNMVVKGMTFQRK